MHHPELDEALVDQALDDLLRAARACTRLRKRPSHQRADRLDRRAQGARASTSVKLDENLPFLGALLKKEQDLVALAEASSRAARSWRS